MARSPLMNRLRRRAKDISTRAIDGVLDNPDRSDKLGSALRGVQKGRKILDEQGNRAVSALGLATQEDVDRVAKRIGKLRKRLTRLLDDLEDAAEERGKA